MQLINGVWRPGKKAASGGGGGGGSAPPNLFALDFASMVQSGPTNFQGSPNNQTATNPWASAISVIADPTPTATGNVADFFYSGAADGTSDDKDLIWTPASNVAFSSHLWVRGKLYIPTGAGAWNTADNRKLIRINNGDGNTNGCDVILHRRDVGNSLLLTDPWVINTVNQNGDPDNYIGATCPNDAWKTIQLHMRMDSGKNTNDGLLEVYLDDASTPVYSISAPMTFATVANTTDAGLPNIAWGSQLTATNGETPYTEHRYWRDLGVSTTMIVP